MVHLQKTSLMTFVSIAAMQAAALPVLLRSDTGLAYRDNQSLYTRPSIINPRIGTVIAPREDEKDDDDDDQPIVKNKKLLADLRSGRAKAKRIQRKPSQSTTTTSASATSTTSTSAAPTPTEDSKKREIDVEVRDFDQDLEARELEELHLAERSPVHPPDLLASLPGRPRNFEDFEEREFEDESLEARDAEDLDVFERSPVPPPDVLASRPRELEEEIAARDVEFDLFERSSIVSNSPGIISVEKQKELESGLKPPQTKQRPLTTEELQRKMRGPMAITTLEVNAKRELIDKFRPPIPVMIS